MTEQTDKMNYCCDCGWAVNNAECTLENAIQYDSAYGFRARASYENLPNVILKMLSFLIKFIGFIEFELVKKG